MQDNNKGKGKKANLGRITQHPAGPKALDPAGPSSRLGWTELSIRLGRAPASGRASASIRLGQCQLPGGPNR